MKLTRKQKQFIDHVKLECKKYGVKCSLKDVKYLKPTPSIRCTGYFDDESGTLQVAMKSKSAFETLVHEYCHLTQWVERVPVYMKATKYLLGVDAWISGKNAADHVVDACIQGVVDLELDNERRSVKTIEKFNLDIDKEQYIRKANAYIYFYHWMRKTRKWSKPENVPYANKSIIKEMPTNLRGKYTSIPKKVERLFKQENI